MTFYIVQALMQLQTLLTAVLGSPMVPVHADPDFVGGGSDYTNIYSIVVYVLLLYPSLYSIYVYTLVIRTLRWCCFPPINWLTLLNYILRATYMVIITFCINCHQLAI